MKRDMMQWVRDMIATPVKTPMPILSFPAIQMMDISVKQLISNATLQACGMQTIARLCNTAAAVSLMDLSVEAQCFGATVRFSDDEVPTVIGKLIKSEEDADNLKIPAVGSGRTRVYIDAVEIALQTIHDRPVFAGCIGPFSLTGRLMDMMEIMYACYDEPELVHKVLGKANTFIKKYIKAYKDIGANGIVIAEPAAGLLSPSMIDEFSTNYVKEIVDELQDDNFIIIYHNCGSVLPLLESIGSIGAAAYHFGNSVDMEEVLKGMPSDVLVMGNIDPAGLIRHGSPKAILKATTHLMRRCCKYPNFVVSTGCDIPPMSPWANIDYFFDAVDMFNETFQSAIDLLSRTAAAG